ncbi:hypothetical protein [Bradyrhizobium sp. AZCC 2289]|uniref:hypothetical protein n=1 Tax=Bradyrhizobium sp. AZCC 2289 TaxID=3117026 RepID=UPI002FF3BD2B
MTSRKAIPPLNGKSEIGFKDFRNLTCLPSEVRNRLARIAEAQLDHPESKTDLLKSILAHRYDPERGFYVPLSARPNLTNYWTEDIATLPDAVHSVDGWNLTLFSNPLTMPHSGSKPSLRATNAGYLIVTHEFDGETPEQFAEVLAWSLDSGAFAQLDKELRKYRDYRGYTSVFAGRRSIHFHFLFDTRHLKYAPFDVDLALRVAEQDSHAAIMTRAYNFYWEFVHDLIQKILKPSVPSDLQLNSYVHWRRTPYGIRILEKPSPIFGLDAGTKVPQIVIKENIRTKAAKGSDAYIVPEVFSVATLLSKRSSTDRRAGLSVHDHDTASMFSEAHLILTGEWGKFPKLASIQPCGDGWVFRFYNHSGDTSPDTYVRGDYKKLVLVGSNTPAGNYFLPDDMTANDFGDYLAILSGQQPLVRTIDTPIVEGPGSESNAGLHRKQSEIERNWPLPMRGLPLAQVMVEYRNKLKGAVAACRDFEGMYSDCIILSGEGIGKTTAHMRFAVQEALFTALDGKGDQQRFNAFAFRSLGQAEEKAAEAEEKTGCKIVIIKSFWAHYEDACEIEGIEPLPRAHFHDRSINGVLKTIQERQPTVFDRLETIRCNIWPMHGDRPNFDAADTLIFTSHPTASSWAFSQMTRTWYHPEFKPFTDPDEQATLRNRFLFDKVIYDEPEIDELLYIIPQNLFRHLTQQHEAVNWKDLPVRKQRELYEQAWGTGVLGNEMTFESYEELMRIRLDKLDRVEVDCDAIPFGHDNVAKEDGSKTGIYRQQHGNAFYLGPKQWLAHKGTHWAFLTTERLVTDVIEQAYGKIPKRLMALRLDNMPDVYPIRIPIFLDVWAGADRPGKQKISVLAKEILNGNSNAVVVADGVDDDIGAMSFQRMKGRNDLADKDVYIILTSLAPELYARLNVIGQWLGIPDIIELHYQGLINQAVGRNTGFRQQNHTKTVVICSHRLWKQTISKLNLKRPRALLYETGQKPW